MGARWRSLPGADVSSISSTTNLRDRIDYVVLHELCHLKEHNHGPRFFKLLDKHMPQWRKRKTRLEEIAEIILNM